ncbi:hypothetical protein SCALM49S_08968 [Streptomyces californicus]
MKSLVSVAVTLREDGVRSGRRGWRCQRPGTRTGRHGRLRGAGRACEQVGPVQEQVLGGQAGAALDRRGCGTRADAGSRAAKRTRRPVCSCEASARPGGERDLDRHTGVRGRLLDSRGARQDDQVGQRDLLAALVCR